ncbi:MAG: hypothetical protein JWO02_2669 [Solirubrobacterales bacterium]|nr:hypothetical protein [Solirubrobacterales bacterium]
MRPTPPIRALLGAALAALTVAGCGGGESAADRADPLAWTAAPQVFKTTALPDDRVAVGSVRNTTSAPLRLDATALTVRDADGRRLRGTGQYAAGYAHGLYGAFQKPDPIPPGELERLGLLITIPPGKTAPLAVSWTLRKGSDPTRAASVDYGPGRLRLPTKVRQGAGGL